jgi:ABC-type nitrate/sulfonate/bicarbonate transport system substrate-binding protein
MRFLLTIVLSAMLTNVTQAQSIVLYLNWFPSAQFAGILEARDRGFYQREGIELKIVFDAKNILETINRAGQEHASIGIASGHEIIQAVSEGKSIKAFAAYYQMNPHSLITSSTSAISNMRDLKGKRLGILSSHEDAIYRVMLNDVRLKPEDVTFVPVKVKDELSVINLLKSRHVDALMAWEFHWPVILALLGHPVRQFPSYKNGFYYYDAFITNNRFLKEHRSLLEGFVRATARGWKEVYRDPKKFSSEIVRRWYPKKRYINHSRSLTEREQYLELTLNKRFLYEGVTPAQYGMMTRLCWRRGIQVAIHNGLLKKSAKELLPEDVAAQLDLYPKQSKVAE